MFGTARSFGQRGMKVDQQRPEYPENSRLQMDHGAFHLPQR